MTDQLPPESPDLPELSAQYSSEADTESAFQSESDYTPPEPETPEPEPEPAEEAAPLVSVRSRRSQVNWGVLGTIILLIALTAFLFGLSRNALPVEILTWWPAAILVVAILWLFGSLARGRASGAIGAAGLIGIGLSLLLATAFHVSLSSTLVGITFIALGMGVILRGLLIRPTPIR